MNGTFFQPYTWDVNFQVSWHLCIYTASHQIHSHTHSVITAVRPASRRNIPQRAARCVLLLMHVTATNPLHLLENTDVSAALRHQLCSVWLQRGTRPAETILTQTGTTWWHLSPSNKHLWGIVSWISHYVGDRTLAKSYGCICLDLPSPRVSKHI